MVGFLKTRLWRNLFCKSIGSMIAPWYLWETCWSTVATWGTEPWKQQFCFFHSTRGLLNCLVSHQHNDHVPLQPHSWETLWRWRRKPIAWRYQVPPFIIRTRRYRPHIPHIHLLPKSLLQRSQGKRTLTWDKCNRLNSQWLLPIRRQSGVGWIVA